MNQFYRGIILSILCTISINIKAQDTKSNEISLDSFRVEVTEIDIIEKPYQSGGLTMSQNQYKVMPASFQDPARILINYPGFSTQNDGANAIIFRGMPPEFSRWQLFGADIVNPNHLANAGTANDLATGNAGGVNALSGSVLDYYHFEPNPADISYSDVMAGVSNMKMASKIKPFIDINLIGLEAGYGQNFGNKSIYIAYRYSFVGLLNKLGMDFGGEKIGYQDVSGLAEIIKSNKSSLKTFGTFGNSSNIFSAVNTDQTPLKFKDIQNINYSSKLAMVGTQFSHEYNNKYFQSTLVYSSRTDERLSMILPSYPDTFLLYTYPESIQKNQLLSWHSMFEIKNRDFSAKIGLRANLQDEKTTQSTHIFRIFTVYPYSQLRYFFNQKLELIGGLASLFDSQTKEFTIEPSLNLIYKIGPYFSTALKYRYSSFRDFTSVFYAPISFDHRRLKAHNFQFEVKYIKKDFQLNAATFFHKISNFTTFSTMSTSAIEHFISFNGQHFGYDQIINSLIINANGKGGAKIYGLDLYAENSHQFGKKTLHYGVNGSIFNSKYSLGEKNDHYYNGRYNFGYTQCTNLSIAWDLSHAHKSRKLIISIANHWRGGLREQSLNSVNLESQSLYNYNSTFNSKFRHYQRLDFRLVYTKSKTGSKLSQRWSLDIQNLLNRQNDGFRYYDPLLNGVFLQKQLGLVPVLSYRLEWSN